MDELGKKIKRVQPLIKIRKTQLERESAELTRIRQEKLAAVERLRSFQDQYIKGVEMLNVERQTPQRGQVSTLERSVDSAKSRWYESLKDLRTIEGQEKAQIAQLIIAERNLKSIEKLDERYVNEQGKQEAANEQKQHDEQSVRRFSQG